MFWFVVLVAYGMTAEYISHRWMMHKRFFPKNGPFDWIYENHSIQHHGLSRYDVNVDMPLWIPIVGILPFVLYFLYVGNFLLVSVCLLGAVKYSFFWTHIHRASHNIKGSAWVKYIPFIEYWLKHHELHHQHPNKNFGTIFIFSDYLFGTKKR